MAESLPHTRALPAVVDSEDESQATPRAAADAPNGRRDPARDIEPVVSTRVHEEADRAGTLMTAVMGS